MDLELRHLRVICAVADTGSVTKAAARLGLAQPALSAQLHRIERALGGALFERDRRGARPTALGELVLARARVLLPAVRGLQDDVCRMTGSGGGPDHCRIGAVNTPVLIGLVHRFSSEFPQAQVTTLTSWSVVELVGTLVAGRLDFVVIGLCGTAAPPEERGLAWRTVGVDAVGVLLPEADPLANAADVRLADLAAKRWAATRGEGCFGDCFAAECAKAGFTPLPAYETDIVSCIALAQEGSAAVLCKPTLPPMAGLRALPLTGAPLRWRHLLGWHEESPAAPLAAKMAAYAEEAFAEAVRRNPGYAKWLDHNVGDMG
ncbi:DNA-binding transcriptional regulator, LysR family [Amycolatopsis marina]|uniref:DNA-binding transcriptional regulator, LysR family n=1 Tax=Amycolatopsis marina TaxID=490629 RepID=A0A1I1CML9_9PSEU|nr:LysR family transcriptional regulator [Amycolatopsis marina]SFB63959.1 DNA-binding transcriptional regulator, LysR family [Amycolatopsis marina]